MRYRGMSRRKFLGGLAAAAAGSAALPAWAQLTAPPPPTNVRIVNGALASSTTSSGNVLGPADFSYLGSFDIQTMGADSPFGQGLTHRYVNGELRFLTFDFYSNAPNFGGQAAAVLTEFSIAGRNFGDSITTPSNRWLYPWSSGTAFRQMNGMFMGLWWDDAAARLWTVDAIDYNATLRPVQIFTRTLNADGTVSNVHGPVGLAGLPDKRIYGGAQAIPSWFQSAYGVGPYAVGWGGYTSLVAQAGGASMGPVMYAIGDPAQFTAGTDMPAGVCRPISDCSSGTVTTDWYLSTGAASPSAFDRGVRVSPVVNYFDGNDPRQNPPTPPTTPPTPGNWLSPAPDGLGRWVWGDSYYNTGCWIDGANKRGFLMIASLGLGVSWYGSSTMHYAGRGYEFHVYDPAHLGEAALGSRPVWNVKPAQLWSQNFDGLGSKFLDGNTTVGNIGGATYDPVSKRLYVLGFAANSYANRLYVFSVNA